MAVDRDGSVYAAFHDIRLGDPDVWLWSLEPGESDWEGPTRVNDNEKRDGTSPAARRYVVKQSTRPIRNGRGFRRAQTLCRGRCSFDVTFVGAKLSLAITDLRPRTTYYYAVTALDNVSGRPGGRSPTVKARMRR